MAGDGLMVGGWAQVSRRNSPPVSRRSWPCLDKLGVLKGVTTFNVHLHLPHYALTTKDSTSIHLLARQPIDLSRPHPFTAAGNQEFNSCI
jgi:hypothetical protein